VFPHFDDQTRRIMSSCRTPCALLAAIAIMISSFALADRILISEGPPGTLPKWATVDFLPDECTDKAKLGHPVSVHYTGWIDESSAAGEPGLEFDGTAGDEPFEFILGIGHVIPGWDLALVGMCVGEKRTLVVPPALAYGNEGAGELIPANATLRFAVEMLKPNPSLLDGDEVLDGALPHMHHEISEEEEWQNLDEDGIDWDALAEGVSLTDATAIASAQDSSNDGSNESNVKGLNVVGARTLGRSARRVSDEMKRKRAARSQVRQPSDAELADRSRGKPASPVEIEIPEGMGGVRPSEMGVPNVFVQIDMNGDREITVDEMTTFFTHMHGLDGIPAGLWDADDKDKDGVISFEEFSGPKSDDEPDEADLFIGGPNDPINDMRMGTSRMT
jgi:hypothetical protein